MNADPEILQRRVLVVAPTGADGTNIRNVLRRAGQEVLVCPNLSAAGQEIEHGCGVFVLTEEALNHERYRDLSRALDAQPAWSRLPVVLIASGGKTSLFPDVAANAIGRRSNLSIVERPVRAATLASAVRSAISARLQQYEVRDLITEREQILSSLEQRIEERTEKLQALNSELEAFSYSVSHDLRAPLRAMESFARILYEEHSAALSEEGRHFAYRIMKNAEKMDRLMIDVLTLSRIGRSEMTLSPIDLSQLVLEVIDQYLDLAAARGHIVIEAPLGEALGDHSSLVQCFSNLLQNALRFVPKERPPAVRVRSDIGPQAVRVEIRDNGVGIDPALHGKIFGMFERVGTLDVPGTGVGLAIVKKAVERMNGAVGVESKLGAGACFGVSLPRPLGER